MAEGENKFKFNEENFNNVFEEFDKNNNGKIEKDELTLLVRNVTGI
jgi:Ca2+-binding EF-hand superfamily protein